MKKPIYTTDQIQVLDEIAEEITIHLPDQDYDVQAQYELMMTRLESGLILPEDL